MSLRTALVGAYKIDVHNQTIKKFLRSGLVYHGLAHVLIFNALTKSVKFRVYFISNSRSMGAFRQRIMSLANILVSFSGNFSYGFIPNTYKERHIHVSLVYLITRNIS